MLERSWQFGAPRKRRFSGSGLVCHTVFDTPATSTPAEFGSTFVTVSTNSRPTTGSFGDER